MSTIKVGREGGDDRIMDTGITRILLVLAALVAVGAVYRFVDQSDRWTHMVPARAVDAGVVAPAVEDQKDGDDAVASAAMNGRQVQVVVDGAQTQMMVLSVGHLLALIPDADQVVAPRSRPFDVLIDPRGGGFAHADHPLALYPVAAALGAGSLLLALSGLALGLVSSVGRAGPGRGQSGPSRVRTAMSRGSTTATAKGRGPRAATPLSRRGVSYPAAGAAPTVDRSQPTAGPAILAAIVIAVVGLAALAAGIYLTSGL